ncbi:MAG: ATP-binding cassette domain-containing protein [Thermodesulfobacteriota bacterium]
MDDLVRAPDGSRHEETEPNPSCSTGESVSLTSDISLFIGSAPECRIRLDAPGVASKQAVVWRRGNRVFLKDWGSGGETAVNGSAVRPGVWKEITSQDEVTVGGAVVPIPPDLFQQKNVIGLFTSPLLYRTGIADRPRFTVLTDGVFLTALPGSFTAVMGPSGSGKSVLLALLAGETRPSQGRVLVGPQAGVWPPDQTGLYDAHRDREVVRDLIGYVPQEDVMIPELTVRESLDTRLRLRFPDLEKSLRARYIEKTCARLGFDEITRKERFLNSTIGASGSGYRGLSGGERKRANIGLELVAKPAILFLDEPTSGLSSIEAERIVALLRDLADNGGLTVVATIHQPSRRSFEQFDDVMLLGLGGRIAYYGPADHAVDYFEALTGTSCGDLNPAAYILDFLDHRETMERVIRAYHDRVPSAGSVLPSPLHTERLGAATGNRLALGRPPCSPMEGRVDSTHMEPADFAHGGTATDSTAEADFDNTSSQPAKDLVHGATHKQASSPRPSVDVSGPGRFATFLLQTITLSRRGFLIALRDKANLVLMGAQVPIIGLLIICAYHGLEHDYRRIDVFARTIHQFNQMADARLARGEAVPVDKLLRQAAVSSETDTSRISEPTARHRAAVLFLMAAASVWFGMIAACREIVGEFHILRRETRSCLRLLPYLVSKLAVLSVLLGIQTAGLSLMVAPTLLGVPLSGLALIALILWLAALGSACLGLLVSSASLTTRVALTAVPVLLVPQLILGGLLRGPASMEQGAYVSRLLSALMTQRWAFEACLATDAYAGSGVLVQQPGDLQNLGWDRGADLKILRVVDKPLADLFFSRTHTNPMVRGMVHMVLLAFLSLVAAYLVLKWRLGPG